MDLSNSHILSATLVQDNQIGETCWQGFQMRLNRTIQDVVHFAKKLPGFAALDQDDQISLIKGGCFEVCTHLLVCSCLCNVGVSFCLLKIFEHVGCKHSWLFIFTHCPAVIHYMCLSSLNLDLLFHAFGTFERDNYCSLVTSGIYPWRSSGCFSTKYCQL